MDGKIWAAMFPPNCLAKEKFGFPVLSACPFHMEPAFDVNPIPFVIHTLLPRHLRFTSPSSLQTSPLCVWIEYCWMQHEL